MRLDGDNSARKRKKDRKRRKRNRAARRERRRASARRIGAFLGVLGFAAAVLCILAMGRPALNVETGQEASATVTARVAFENAEGTTVAAGTVLVERGQKVQAEDIDYLERERGAFRRSPAARWLRLQHLGGLGIALVLIVTGAVSYVERFRGHLLLHRSAVAAFVLLTLALVACARYCVSAGVTPLAVPIPFMTVVMCLVFDQRFALSVAVFCAMLVRLACPGADYEFVVLLLGGISAALLSRQVRTRSTLIKVGLLVGVVQFCAAWSLLLVFKSESSILLSPLSSSLVKPALAALANGALSGFVVSGLLPGIERMFDVTTDVRLLEWSDPNQPLLQKLLVEAPGTYHHSMVVGTLAADAAESVGANPLLARVSAYFHDVGKVRKPRYFAENIQSGERNPHDELSPSMSSLIITAHPKDGADMAEEYGVPREVRDIILQSHGSSVLKYFYNRARERADGQTAIEEQDYRYRLPKPHGKEAAIVMLCDAAESAVRSMDSPSVSQMRNMVHDITMDRLHDGQLDESTLTITELKRAEDAIVHGLTAVFHSRISYPGQEAKAEEEPAAVEPESAEEPQEATADGD